MLIPDIQDTARIVDAAVRKVREQTERHEDRDGDSRRLEAGGGRLDHSQEERYMAIMKELQFGESKYNNANLSNDFWQNTIFFQIESWN